MILTTMKQIIAWSAGVFGVPLVAESANLGWLNQEIGLPLWTVMMLILLPNKEITDTIRLPLERLREKLGESDLTNTSYNDNNG